MNVALTEAAARISTKLEHLYQERRQIGNEGIVALEKLDPELGTLAKDVWDNDLSAVSKWFTDEIRSLGGKTPWQCLADGERENVVRVLNAIEYGLGA